MMKRASYSLGLLLLGVSLIINLVNVQEALDVRLPVDRKIGSRVGSIARRAGLYGLSNATMITELEELIQKLRSEGHTRVVFSYSGKHSNVLASTAIHSAWPMQIIEQEMPSLKRNERLLVAASLNASHMISVRPGQGWVATPVETAIPKRKAGAGD